MNDFKNSQSAKMAEIDKALLGLAVLADLPIGDVRKVKGGDVNHPSYEVLEWTQAQQHGGLNFNFVIHTADDHVLSWKKGQKYSCRAKITKIEWKDRNKAFTVPAQTETDGINIWLDAVDDSVAKANK
jgi:hypothetical protein